MPTLASVLREVGKCPSSEHLYLHTCTFMQETTGTDCKTLYFIPYLSRPSIVLYI